MSGAEASQAINCNPNSWNKVVVYITFTLLLIMVLRVLSSRLCMLNEDKNWFQEAKNPR